MNFRIADTFSDSLAKLTADEQKTVKTTVFDLQADPKHPSLQFHKVEQSKDARFWSVRGNLDLRLIVHKDGDDLLLCYVDHHDDAYEWARRRKIEVHPKTGAAQLVEIRQSVREIVIPKYIEDSRQAKRKAALFDRLSDDELLAFGIPIDWLVDTRAVTEDTILDLCEHLPREAAEALLELATGGKPVPELYPIVTASPFEHPDAQRRFRVMHNAEELERALDAPWDKWTIFLHPAQRALIERSFAGPARVSGSAGTGKTIVALHRAVFLARRNTEMRVLITTFSDSLANALRTKLRRLVSGEPRLKERIEVDGINALGRRLYERNFGPLKLASRGHVQAFLSQAVDAAGGSRFSSAFLLAEWEQVVDAWRLDSWEAYRNVARLGRKTRLSEAHRKALWSIFEGVRALLAESGMLTWPDLFQRLAILLGGASRQPFDAVVVDEAQDVSITQLRFLAAMTRNSENGLFLAGDIGQRIFQQPFSWKSLGVDVRGRSFTLNINYRTSHQIRSRADRLLDPEMADVDGNAERRDGTISTFNGPAPEIKKFASDGEEIRSVSDWLHAKILAGSAPHEIAIFVRSEAQIDRAEAAAEGAGVAFKVLDQSVETTSGHISICAMHLAKGLEFRAVAVMACDDGVIPSQQRIDSIGDEADLEEVFDSERRLLYVACTRARDYLLVSGVEPASEFLSDL